MGPTAAFIAAGLAWVSNITGLPASPAPLIDMSGVGRGREVIERTARLDDGKRHIGALTYPGVVYLPRDWTAGEPADDCLLMHELTHVLQYASGRRYRCVPEMEPLAWFVEDLCLEQRGVDFWQQKGYRAIAVAQEALCAG